MFDEWRTRFSPLEPVDPARARSSGLARTFSDWGTAGPVPSRDRADGFEYVGRGGRVCANCSRPSPTARCRRRQPKPNSEGTSSARRADSMRPATGVAGSRRRFSQRGRPPHRSLHWLKTALETMGRALLTRVSDEQFERLEAHLDETARRRRSTGEAGGPSNDAGVRPAVARRDGRDRKPVGLSMDRSPTRRNSSVWTPVRRSTGSTISASQRFTRTLDQLDRFREADVLVVAAGRRGRSRPSSPASSTPRSSAFRSRAATVTPGTARRHSPGCSSRVPCCRSPTSTRGSSPGPRRP